MCLKLKLIILSSCISFLGAVQVEVEQGLLEGEILDTVDGVSSYYSFKGIPYAAPPVGDLRFKPPEPALSWEGVRQATEHGAICPQYDNLKGFVQNETEDCLFLNVYSPNLIPDTPLPVIFYIPGGGYKFGSGNVYELGPDFLVSKDVIIVTFNYRVDALGFLCLDTEQVPGNAGMKDQVAALRWVLANIANFGGDPDNITIMGESASAASLGLFLLSPMTEGLFQRAIILSGSALCEWNLPYKPAERGIMLGKILGSNTNDPHETYEFLKNVSVASIINNTASIMLAEERIFTTFFRGTTFIPVVEKDFGQERFLTDEIMTLLERGEVHNVSIIMGRTDQEIIPFVSSTIEELTNTYERFPDLQVPREILYVLNARKNKEVADMVHGYYFGNNTISENTIPEFVEMLNDIFVNYNTNRFLSKLLKSSSSAQIFAYIFSVLTDRNPYGWLLDDFGVRGAGHQDDLAYLFDPKGLNLTLSLDGPEYQAIESITTLFTNFAKFGHPTPDSSLGFIWPEYTQSSGEYLDLGVELTVNSNMAKDMEEFWMSVYDFAGIKY